MPERRIYDITHGAGNVQFDTADKLLSAMDATDEWYTTLYDIYAA